MNNNNVAYISDTVRRYSKNYVANNPNWDHPTLLKKIEARAKMEAEDFKIKLSQDELSTIKKLAFRGLEGEMEDATSFEDNKEWTDWLSKRKKNKEINYTNWSSYRFLLSSKPNWTEGENGTLSKLDLNTERILSKLADPKGTSLVRKGMVVGNVQSGKTANYIGLMCKAADAGYKVIIVLAGMLDDLRIQTQIRVEEGFIGKNACNQELVGVGEIDGNPSDNNKLAFTTREDDFKIKTAKAFGALNFLNFESTCIFVIKKNTTILKNLNRWLSRELRNYSLSKANGSLLLIDDEADNASINTKAGNPYLTKKRTNKEYDDDDVDPSKINGQIRKLIQKFNICTYVGYTATPFANIFISPLTDKKMFGEDLFPKHFIQYIKPPSIYFGPSKIFVEKVYKNLVKYIPSDEIYGIEEYCIPKGHKKNFKLEGLPKSLKNAIHSFLIATSIRDIRQAGIPFHSSMLVNPSTFTDVQISVKSKIQDYIEILNQQFKWSNDSYLISEIKEVWDTDFGFLQKSYSWDFVLNKISELIEDIEIVVVNNSRKSQKLEYEKFKKDGRKIIVVGGFSLSRGLTLEGLVTSYYLRYSKMYDSMLQMGRWFGYRMGYEDICKLYLSKESHEDFEIVSNAVEELSIKFEEMQAINATPIDFGLQIRADAQNKGLSITAKNKMGAAQKTRSYSYSGRLVQNYCFERSKISENLKAVDSFHSKLLEKYPNNKLVDNRYYGFRDVDGNLIYDLLNTYHISELNDTIRKDSLLKYFKERLRLELKNWHIIFDANINSNSKNGVYSSVGVNIPRVGRQVTTKFINLNKTIFLSKPLSRAICSPNIADKVFTEKEKKINTDKTLSKKMLASRLANKFDQPVLVIAFCNPTFNPTEYTSVDESESVKKEIGSIPTVASINFLFPYSKQIREKLIEVYENAEITDLYGNYNSYMEDGDD